MSDSITTVSELEKLIGRTPGPRDLKVIDHLDEQALRWISISNCLFVCLFDEKEGIFATIGGGKPGFIRAETNHLIVPLNAIDHPENLQQGKGWGSLFLVPTLNETLRVNGVIESVEKDTVTVKVVECYLHCAKALMRSNFWQPTTTMESVSDTDSFLATTTFMVVASSDELAQADISPKGDFAGKLLCQYAQSVWYPERPGNRRVDGYRNMLRQPKIEILALIPGDTTVLRLSGSANLSINENIRKDFAVKNKIPTMVTEVHSQTMTIEHSPALKRAELWPAKAPGIEIKGADIFKAHIKLSKLEGIQAKLAKKAVTIPGAFEKALEIDYQKNQY